MISEEQLQQMEESVKAVGLTRDTEMALIAEVRRLRELLNRFYEAIGRFQGNTANGLIPINVSAKTADDVADALRSDSAKEA